MPLQVLDARGRGRPVAPARGPVVRREVVGAPDAIAGVAVGEIRPQDTEPRHGAVIAIGLEETGLVPGGPRIEPIDRLERRRQEAPKVLGGIAHARTLPVDDAAPGRPGDHVAGVEIAVNEASPRKRRTVDRRRARRAQPHRQRVAGRRSGEPVGVGQQFARAGGHRAEAGGLDAVDPAQKNRRLDRVAVPRRALDETVDQHGAVSVRRGPVAHEIGREPPPLEQPHGPRLGLGRDGKEGPAPAAFAEMLDREILAVAADAQNVVPEPAGQDRRVGVAARREHAPAHQKGDGVERHGGHIGRTPDDGNADRAAPAVPVRRIADASAGRAGPPPPAP